ncbi:glycosyltransferase family 4 protein [Frondihabitans sp. 4ASC-45]|uniref:glycosyltransferase family 4 protein n=1 Tax=Frondihabitans sp. 4ASC-45 TaxID=3111636 RepID=UPI003C20D71D
MNVPPPKILIIGLHFTPEATGNAPYTTALAAGLVAQGRAVQVITGPPHYPEWRIREGYGGWMEKETIRGVPVRRLRHYVPSAPGSIKRLLSELSFGVRTACVPWGKPDVVLLVSPALFSSLVVTLRIRLSRRRIPVGVWVQDIYSLGVTEAGSSGRLVAGVVKAIESFVLRSASGVSVIHERFRETAIERLGVSRSKITVIRNWSHMTVPTTTDRADRAVTRATLGWSDEIVVLHAGNMGAKQGLENVIEAAREADRRGVGVRFILLGDGNQRAQLEALSSGIDRVQFMAPVADEDFYAALCSADVLLVNEKPGVTEMSVPSKLTSYFTTGRPVLAATEPGSVTANEIEVSGGGVTVAAGDPRALLDAALELGRDVDEGERLGRNGLAFRREMLDEKSAVTRFGGWLEKISRATSDD